MVCMQHANKQVISIFASIFTLLLLYTLASPQRFAPGSGSHSHIKLSDLPGVDDPEPLASLGLSGDFDYTRRCIVPRPKKNTKRLPRQDLDATFSPLAALTRLHNDPLESVVLPGCNSVLTIDVPGIAHSRPTCPQSALTIGVATTRERLEVALEEMARWLSHTDVQLMASVMPANDSDDPSLHPLQVQAEALAINAVVLKAPDTDPGRANFALAASFRDHARPDTQWFAVIDDDTFFPDLDQVLAALHQYDATKEHYIGAYTENHESRGLHGLLAQGGAGIFISAPLMKKVGENYEECAKNPHNRPDHIWGDHTWRDAIRDITSPPVFLTSLPGLHQLDLGGEMAGFYESGLSPLLSLHHWKSWHHQNHPLAHLVADVAGPATYLQRYVTADQAVFVNGFSISSYRDGLPDLNLMEHTFEPVTEPIRPEDLPIIWRDTFGTLRPRLNNDEKRSWLWQHSVKAVKDLHTVCVRQFYVRKANAMAGGSSVDQVIEVDWCEG